jgi:hypothetical protein
VLQVAQAPGYAIGTFKQSLARKDCNAGLIFNGWQREIEVS